MYTGTIHMINMKYTALALFISVCAYFPWCNTKQVYDNAAVNTLFWMAVGARRFVEAGGGPSLSKDTE